MSAGGEAAALFFSAFVIVSLASAFFKYLRVRGVPYKGHGLFKLISNYNSGSTRISERKQFKN